MSFFTSVCPEIHRGNTRIVWVFHYFGFAIKFPIIDVRLFMRGIKICLYDDRHEVLRSLKLYLTSSIECDASAKLHLFGGIVANWNEFIFYCKHGHNRFLMPTIFSFFGLFNIMLSGKEIGEAARLYKTLSDATNKETGGDRHHFQHEGNFCSWMGGLSIVDYGGRKTQKILLRHFPKLNALTSEDVR